MSAPTPFTASTRVILDATGQGVASIGPAGVDWLIKTTTVSATTQVLQSQANTYHGGVSPANLVDGTLSGSSGDTSDTVILLQPGEQLFCQWTGGDAGASAFLRVAGLSYPAGQGALNM